MFILKIQCDSLRCENIKCVKEIIFTKLCHSRGLITLLSYVHYRMKYKFLYKSYNFLSFYQLSIKKLTTKTILLRRFYCKNFHFFTLYKLHKATVYSHVTFFPEEDRASRGRPASFVRKPRFHHKSCSNQGTLLSDSRRIQARSSKRSSSPDPSPLSTSC